MAPGELQAIRRLIDAVVDVGSGLDLATILTRVVESAVALSGARYGALGVLDDSGTTLDDFITVGIDESTRREIGSLPRGEGVLRLLIDGDGRPMRLDDLGQHPSAVGFPAHHPPMHSFLGVPIRVRDRTFGDLYLTEKHGGGSFTDEDEELVVGLAAAAGVAIDNARLHERLGQLAVVRDRERIGRDLHDTVIQRLFATGLALQGIQARCASEAAELGERIGEAIDELDETVKHIRSVIFALESDGRGGHLRSRLLQVCEDAVGALGFPPRVAFNGSVDSLVDDATGNDLLATLREALSNVARHADATSVDVIVSASPVVVELTVHDDGRGGAGIRPGGRGVRNMAARAEDLGGTCTVEDARGGGTSVVWRVPGPAGLRETP